MSEMYARTHRRCASSIVRLLSTSGLDKMPWGSGLARRMHDFARVGEG